ncbi:MAG: high-affinity branched-chain amino acid ABC transporter permease LivM [Rhodobiaceae bacterium]|nr:high-affinity branched-chain amino acid ABC transporter permease LivM [Rhodobiaceae bacterium]MCC0012247.1 high-affinity branched-chain amino acid ABC transporter permease LivM [Rhodobiaceae bacterium]MCC0019044.1 high-affinity branched-chain amino acid ABC transporter permease LivM [Rhodobiaceae bacterium]MCC0050897.1 high-affinity branched-chain amino acid ABC transporter permease LivM [Rhodobiaceae bacterium]MCC0060838.1 high-affinity branched-chain amino acid ABC transporter permease Liv
MTTPASTSPGRVFSALKDAFLAAIVALALAAPMLGFQVFVSGTEIQLEPRWWLVGYATAAVFVGRLIFRLVMGGDGHMPVGQKWFRRAGGRPLGTPTSGGLKFIAVVALIFAFAFPFLPFTDRYILDLAILVVTYIMLGWGLNIVVGLAGLLDLGYVAFYAVGAYSFALLAQHFDLGFWFALPIAGILAAFWGIILGFPVLRLRGDYLAIVTLAFGEIIRVILLNWYDFTNGPDGISGIPRPTLFGIPFDRSSEGFAATFGLDYSSQHRIIFLYYVILLMALFTNFVTLRLRRLPIGRAWEALREDEIACRSLGINTTNTKLTAFAMGAMFGGFAGSFFATRQGFISPESFTFIESALILAIVVLGGLGSQIGVVIAAIVMIGGFELFRDLEQYRMLIFGILMVTIMIWRPRGLISSRTPSAFLHERKQISAENVSEGHG